MKVEDVRLIEIRRLEREERAGGDKRSLQDWSHMTRS